MMIVGQAKGWVTLRSTHPTPADFAEKDTLLPYYGVVIAALVFRRRLGWLKMVWANGTVTPLVCRETVHEITRILVYAKFKLSASEQKALLQLYLPFAELVVLRDALPDLPVACRGSDDKVFIHLALGGAADFSVTGDGDLLALRGMVPARIVTVEEWKGFLG